MADMKPWRALVTALVVALLPGCVSVPATTGQAQIITGTRIAAADPGWRVLLDDAATQVRRCYRGPRVGHAGRQIITRLRVNLMPDGGIEGRPAVIAQEGVTPLNRLYAERMAAAAIDSVLRCAPLSVPPGFAGAERIEFELTFAPLASA